MSTYAIGDIQGCYDSLQALLAEIKFNPKQDYLWLTGDLVNRGPKSLEVLRFIKQLPNKIIVLGNHDLHLLLLANNHPPIKHTLTNILNAPDCNELIDWLRQQPFLHHDKQLNFILVHSGIYPYWNLSQAKQYAEELSQTLRSENYHEFLNNMYGNDPSSWNESLTDWDRLRFITNAFTRMRFIDKNRNLELNYRGPINGAPPGCLPWFKIKSRATQHEKIIFGHWAALSGNVNTKNIFALDTGCIWNGWLTAMRLEDEKFFRVKCRESTS